MAETILETIAAHTRRRVEEDRRRLPLELLRDQCGQEGQAGGRRFLNALQGRGLGLICEVKKASPSKGILSEDFPYLDVARDYQAAGADCISCLTEPKWFLGSDQVFGDIRASVSIPMLRKDFTVDEYQIYQTRLLGAEAVLLICALLDTRTIARYLELSGPVRPDRPGVLHFRRAGLPRHRAGARLAPRHRTGGVRARHGQRGGGRL